MKQKLFVVMLMFIFLIANVTAINCIEELIIELNVYGLDDRFEYEESSYQPRGKYNFAREGDMVFIEKVSATLNVGCEKEIESFLIEFKRPSENEFGEQLQINLELGNEFTEVYTLRLDKDEKGRPMNFKDSFGNTVGGTSTKILNEEGVWEFRVLYPDKNIFWKVSLENSGYPIIDNEIEVMDRLSVIHLRTLEQLRENSEDNSGRALKVMFFIGLATIFLQAMAIGVMVWVGREQIGEMKDHYEKPTKREDKREEERQLDLLRTLLTELTFLEKNLNSYKETFSKKSHYPFYELWNIDAALYLRTLNHMIKGKETIGLKENLMILKDKLLIINNMKLESKKDEERKGNDRLIQAKIEVIRKGIIKIIDEDILPPLKKSKKFIEKEFNFSQNK